MGNSGSRPAAVLLECGYPFRYSSHVSFEKEISRPPDQAAYDDQEGRCTLPTVRHRDDRVELLLGLLLLDHDRLDVSTHLADQPLRFCFLHHFTGPLCTSISGAVL